MPMQCSELGSLSCDRKWRARASDMAMSLDEKQSDVMGEQNGQTAGSVRCDSSVCDVVRTYSRSELLCSKTTARARQYADLVQNIHFEDDCVGRAQRTSAHAYNSHTYTHCTSTNASLVVRRRSAVGIRVCICMSNVRATGRVSRGVLPNPERVCPHETSSVYVCARAFVCPQRV